jgi:hypothetical protein
MPNIILPEHTKHTFSSNIGVYIQYTAFPEKKGRGCFFDWVGIDGNMGRVIYILLKNNLNTQSPMK